VSVSQEDDDFFSLIITGIFYSKPYKSILTLKVDYNRTNISTMKLLTSIWLFTRMKRCREVVIFFVFEKYNDLQRRRMVLFVYIYIDCTVQSNTAHKFCFGWKQRLFLCFQTIGTQYLLMETLDNCQVVFVVV